MTERPDRIAAALSARLQGSRVLIGDATTELGVSYANPDGTVTVEASSGVARVRQGERWAPIDTSLVVQGGVLKPKVAKAAVEFSAGGDGTPLVKLTREDGRSLALGWPSALPAPQVKGNTATYTNAAGLPGADLVVTALPTGFQHDVVLRERPSGPVEFKLPVSAEKLSLQVTGQGGLKLADAKGKTVAAAPTPYMIDTPAPAAAAMAATPGREASDQPATADRGRIDVSVVEENGQQVLVLKPDPVFLADPATTYPVTVDPAISLTAVGDLTIVSPKYQSNGSTLRVGNADNLDGTRDFARALLAFDTGFLAGKTVTDAKLELQSSGAEDWGCVTGQGIKAQRITATWDHRYTFWNNQPTAIDAGEVLGVEPGACSTSGGGIPQGIWSWQVTDMAKQWASGAGGHGIMLRAVTEDPTPHIDQYSRVWQSLESAGTGGIAPKLTITYGSTPAVEQLRAAPVVVNDSAVYTSSTTPTLFAGTKDPDGGVLRVEYEVESDPAAGSSGQLWTGAVDGVQAGDNAKITVAAGKLTDATKVRWRARALDGTDASAWSSWQLLTIDASAPAAPTIECLELTQNGWGARRRQPGDPTECSLSSASADWRGFYWGLDDPTTPNRAMRREGTVEWPNARPIKIDPADGWHTLYVRTTDKAHNASTVTAFAFGIGAGGLVKPALSDRTQRFVSLVTSAAPERTQVRYEFRTGGSTGGFTALPVMDVTPAGSAQPITAWPQTRTDTSKNFSELVWDLAKTLREAKIPDGAIELRACLTGSSASEACSDPVKVTLDQSAFGGSYATTDVGLGKVAMQTGDFSLSNTDVSLFGVSVGRTLNSLNPGAERGDEQLAENKVFGPGWRAAFPSVSSGIADFSPTSAGESGSLQLVGGDGTTLSYVKNGASFTGLGDAADGSRITATAEQLTVTEATGSKTTYTQAGGKWVVARTETAAAESAVTYYRDSTGRVTRILAPVSAGLTCETTLAPGCRALELSYAAATTATGVADGWGDFVGQVKNVSFSAFDPESNAMKSTALATYAYDSTGRLRQVTDPRTSLATVYYYTGEGRISQLTPPGLAPWRLDYDSRGRLAHVQREGGDVDPTHAVAYDVPIGGSGAPIDLTAAQSAKWGQASDLPVVGSGVFPASHVPARGSDGAYRPASAEWEYAALTYTDVNGRRVNSAAYGAGAWQINAARYDDKGNTVWEITPGNRAQALAPTADTEPYVAARTDSAERANLLASVRIYNADSDLLASKGPAHTIKLTTGTLVSARLGTRNIYDEGKPNAGADYHLITTAIAEPEVLDGVSNPGTADQRTVKSGYDPIASGDKSGWELRTATTQTVVVDGGSNITRTTRYDAAGRVIESRMPQSNGADAGTMTTSYYTGDGSGPASCRKPAWSGLACRSEPKAQPTTGKPLPVVEMKSYTYWGQAAVSNDIAGSVTRTRTTRYDGAGRTIGDMVTATPQTDAGTAVAEAATTYDPATGLATATTAGGASVSAKHDSFGRMISYTDADGNTATTTYTLDGAVSTFADGKGTTTYTYDGVDAAGRTERRGFPTKVEATGVGAFTGAYDANGALALQTYPGGLTTASRYDHASNKIGLDYTKNGIRWLGFTNTPGVDGVASASGPGGNQDYTYDAVGRLTEVADTYRGTCVTRVYTFTPNSNRSRMDSHPAAGDGKCSTGNTPSTRNYAFDQADRLIDPGYAYDALGRTTSLPANDAPDGTALTVGYHTNDLVASVTAGGVSRQYTLDPENRVRTTVQTGGSAPGTTVLHYGDDGDSPVWIAEANGTWTRNVDDLTGGFAAVQASDGTVTLQLSNLHGDVVATSQTSAQASGIDAYFEQTEYGLNRNDNASNPSRYGWLGTAQRASDPLGGLHLMGARLYNSATGRFLQVDPVAGGSANAYEYAGQDPINNTDLDGRCFWDLCVAETAAVVIIGALVIGLVTSAAVKNAYDRCVQSGCTMQFSWAHPTAGPLAVSVPYPNPKSRTALKHSKTPYIVYKISGPNGEVYKYGISRRGTSRPASQLGKCNNYYGVALGCTYSVVRHVVGWYNARLMEANLIADYVRKHKRCPPGQRKSCR